MSNNMNAIEIRALMDISLDEWINDGQNTSKVVKLLIVIGMVKEVAEDKKYKLTPMGQFYVNHLMSIPMPVIKWEIPNVEHLYKENGDYGPMSVTYISGNSKDI